METGYLNLINKESGPNFRPMVDRMDIDDSEGPGNDQPPQPDSEDHHLQMIFTKLLRIQQDDIQFREEISAQIKAQTEHSQAIEQQNKVFSQAVEEIKKTADDLQNEKVSLQNEKVNLQRDNETRKIEVRNLKHEIAKFKKTFQAQEGFLQRLEGQAVDETMWVQFQTLKARANDLAGTIEFIQNQRDLRFIDYHLFRSTPPVDVWSCLRRIQDQPPFSAEESRLIRQLFVKTNLFMRGAPNHTFEEPDRTNPVAGCFLLDVQVRQMDVSPTEDLLNRRTDFRYSLQLVTKIHTQQRIPSYIKGSGQANFGGFLDRLLNFINDILPRGISVAPYHTYTVENGKAVVSFEREDHKWFVYEVVPWKALSRGVIRDTHESRIEYGAMVPSVQRLVGYMVTNGCMYGMITNEDAVVFVEIDLKKWYRIPVYDKTLPIKIYATHINATEPSCIETMTSWFMGMKREGEAGQMMQKLYSHNRPFSTEGVLFFHTIDCPRSYLHHNGSRFQLFEVAAEQVEVFQHILREETFEHNLQPDESLVLKIFNPVREYPGSMDTFNQRVDWFKELYAKELECTQRLRKDPEFNNCYFEQGLILAAVLRSGYVSSGPCLISRYIESEPVPNNEETYQIVKQQLEVVHRNKIVHDYITADNILYEAGTIYLINFASAILDPKPEDYSKDHEELDKLFADRNKANKQEYLT